MKKVGIDALAFYIPKLFVDLSRLAKERDIPYEKLNKGLGLKQMSVPDLDEDAASFAASALIRLIEDHDLDPREIGRVYLGTESAVDGSKPTATYALGAAQEYFAKKFGADCFNRCDTVDLTFACIGGVDALQNCLDWVVNGVNRKAVVIASDVSKYELNSTGEYTQGAGAVAILLAAEPRILTIDPFWGIGFKSVGDFFKPRRLLKKYDLAKNLAEQLVPGITSERIGAALSSADSHFWRHSSSKVALYKEEPVFDGQYSNQCYSNRISEAFDDFNKVRPTNFLKDWDHIVFHLPYAYHGRRIILDNWLAWLENEGGLNKLFEQIGPIEDDSKQWRRLAAKSALFQKFVSEKIEMGERASSRIGNMYTASIFMSLISLCASAKEKSIDLSDRQVGFVAYGSGSKAKVFQGKFAKGWEKACSNLDIFGDLNSRQSISVAEYGSLHNASLDKPLTRDKLVYLSGIEEQNALRMGLRTYAINEQGR